MKGLQHWLRRSDRRQIACAARGKGILEDLRIHIQELEPVCVSPGKEERL